MRENITIVRETSAGHVLYCWKKSRKNWLLLVDYLFGPPKPGDDSLAFDIKRFPKLSELSFSGWFACQSIDHRIGISSSVRRLDFCEICCEKL